MIQTTHKNCLDLSGLPHLGARQIAALSAIAAELNRAMEQYPPFASAHEGHSIIREEYVELEREVFMKRRSRQGLGDEATHLGAMAARLLADIVYDPEKKL